MLDLVQKGRVEFVHVRQNFIVDDGERFAPSALNTACAAGTLPTAAPNVTVFSVCRRRYGRALAAAEAAPASGHCIAGRFSHANYQVGDPQFYRALR